MQMNLILFWVTLDSEIIYPYFSTSVYFNSSAPGSDPVLGLGSCAGVRVGVGGFAPTSPISHTDNL